ncbi:transcription termination/antitermination protein NusG [Stieleria sp. TO1_6]|uniref:transcription termination/antitermination protein NusG n=1 Tax=Stieleria tagensis TaxID=2956795 RepID=UPI00209B8EB2|nr:transcription termination/antitermination protein NusG [Stieleria tagensis]MCO8120221.1 transcription termination/antitermination protein NusG [Stieleria tagensis]
MTDDPKSATPDETESIDESNEVIAGEGSIDGETVQDSPVTESTGEVFLDSDDDDDDNGIGVNVEMDWYILKVAFNREDSIADALRKKIVMEGMEEFFDQVVVPSEDVATFTRDGKKRISKRKLLPGYIMARMAINDDTWFLVRETGGISDFTGSAGKPMPMDPLDVERFINRPVAEDEEEAPIKTAIPFKVGDRVRVKEGNFENQEGDVDAVDEANGRITVIINIFGRSVPMELDHWQVEPV